MDRSAIDIVFSIVLTWGWGLAVPLILRYAILKRPLDKVIALFIAGGLWLLNIFIFTALGSQSRTHAALFLVAAVSYWILTKKAAPQPEVTNPVFSPTDGTPPADSLSTPAEPEQRPDLVDNGFKGKRIHIFLVATVISALLAAVFGKTSSDWFLLIPVVATFFSVLVVGQPESTRNWRNTIIWSGLFTPIVLIVSFIAFGIVINLIK